MQTLDLLQLNKAVTVKSLSPNGVTSKLVDMGLYPGKTVEVVFKAPFGGPIAIDLDGYTLSLRMDEASLVEVE
ncbi:MAG: ferrous iron transport protein A [Flammeovirgaceae bacterium]|nr:ferrous iron transport protein A [Flammeovirgaceae bacterium]MBE60740.1 ferrous iron transport protein A [Flammeovirgaceae bacterium]MBR09987.1 ferrous iron transport protein A [Rickettsiales bacterium]HCX21973.1 ferrous iron transport protein A [Cytophagales bacterium]|tara:strand:- start:235 stop:453 length:219 start_codon:yes stop_codon:yes gene_type:complete